MHYKVIIILSLIVLEFISSSQLSSLAAPIDDWQKLIQEGSSQKFDGQYKTATESFTKALAIAEKEKLPAKCLPISLCRLVSVEVVTNQITQADPYFQRIVDLIKIQKEENILDPKVSFWAAVLSDEYMSNTKPETRETGLKRACYLKDVIYGSTHRECLECLSKLADCYIDNGKIDKAIRILTLAQAVIDKKYGKNPDALSQTLDRLAIRCRKEHKYEQAKQLELAAMKAINKNSSLYLHLSRPAFYCFAGINAFAQKKDTEGYEFFRKTIEECSKIETKKKRDMACQYLGALDQFILTDIFEDNRAATAEKEIRLLLAVYKALHREPKNSNSADRILVNVLQVQHKNYELIQLLKDNLKDPHLTSDEKAGMYCLIATTQTSHYTQHIDIDEANKSFSLAFNFETNKKGRHATAVLLWWATALVEHGYLRSGIEKLNMVYKQSRVLPANQRGTLLSDVLQEIAILKKNSGHEQEAQILFQESAKEYQAQKKAKTELWPDLYGRNEKQD